ncbi:MAG: quaternary ammonium compound efflux SMR transporter SugE [Cellvibrio sp.]
MNWILLILAGLFEIGWAIGLKYTEGFTRLWPSLLTVFAMLLSLALLGIVMKTLPVSTAYAVWMGIGVVGTAILGVVILGEPATFGRLFSIALILMGVIGLKLTTAN